MADGQLDESYNPVFTDIRSKEARIGKISYADESKLIVAGVFTHCNGTLVSSMVRLNPDGTLDETFEPPLHRAFNPSWLLTVLSDGSVITRSTDNQNPIQLSRLRGDTTPQNKDLWAAAHGLSAYEATSDSDNDGFSQEIELLYDLDPTQPDFVSLFTLEKGESGMLGRVMPPVFPESVPEVSFSTDLTEWEPKIIRPDFTIEIPQGRGFLRFEKRLNAE